MSSTISLNFLERPRETEVLGSLTTSAVHPGTLADQTSYGANHYSSEGDSEQYFPPLGDRTEFYRENHFFTTGIKPCGASDTHFANDTHGWGDRESTKFTTGIKRVTGDHAA